MHATSDLTLSESYRSDIDGLRAVAVLLVLIFHFELITGSHSGFIGVDIFFVISGYLVTSIITRQLQSNSFNLAQFYIGRVRRLSPALLVVLTLVFIAGVWLLFPNDLIELARQIFFSQIYAANFYFWRNFNYFGLGTSNVYLLHMWSLAVEEQFYLFFPLILIAAHRYIRAYYWHFIASLLLVSFLLNIAFVDQKPEATFYLLPTRAWELLVGSITCFLLTRWEKPSPVDHALGLLGAGLIAVGVGAYTREVVFPGYFALLPVLGAASVILAGRTRSALVYRLLALPPLTYIGRISYPLYLVHWPVNVFASRALGEQYGLGMRFAMFALSLLLAALIYHGVEKPIRQRRVFGQNRSLLLKYGFGFVSTIILFFVVKQSAGLPQGFRLRPYALPNC